MALEFNKVVGQVAKMGGMLQAIDFDLDDRLGLAWERFQQTSDLDDVREHIEWVRQSNVSGYRGAAPLDIPTAEVVNTLAPPPSLAPAASIIAADGGQIYPDDQAKVHYYLINIGLFIYHHGTERTPEILTDPTLFFHKSHVHDRYGRVIRNRTVDGRRTVAEMKGLAEEAWRRRDAGIPIITIYDNQLMFLNAENAAKGEDLMRDYLAALIHLHDSGAVLGGYVDNPYRSKRVMQLLYLMSLRSKEEVHEKQMYLSQAGDLDGLRDKDFFDAVLEPGARSAIMVQNSPQNYEFKLRGVNYEVAFFYLKVFNEYQSQVVRVDIPVWVARDKQKVDLLHSVLLDQCKMQGRNPYPYALTRADELAYIGMKDKDRLQEMINLELRKNGIDPTVNIPKVRGKELARSGKRYFEMK